MAITSVATLLVTSIGLAAVYVQIAKIRNSIWGDTHGRLCDQSLEILRFLAEEPNAYDYFYSRKVLEDNGDTELRIFTLYAAEAIANFLEHITLQQVNLPAEQWRTWQRFVISTYERSLVVQEFIEDHHEWYSDRLHSLVNTKNFYPPR
jgi:hypothetical protein